MKKLILLILSLLSCSLFAYTYQKTSNGSNIKWNERGNSVNFYIDSSNSSGISSSDLNQITNESFSEWNNSGGIQLSGIYGSSGTQSGRNDITFSNNALLFSGNSVLAITRNIFNDETGTNLESDIYIKDSVTFSSDSTSDQYIGSILSHEVGHSLGLDHSNNLFSTMFYQIVRGQLTLDSDDIMGKTSLYSNPSNIGSIRGSIAGGVDKVAVFGATVKLISSSEGKVVASVLSDDDGTFQFTDVAIDDVYYVYVEPTKLLESISSYYHQVKSDFCSGFAQFEGSFFETCDSSRRGKPQGIWLSSSETSVNLGTITIKCGFDTPLNYYSARDGSGFELNNLTTNLGESIVGFFTSEDINNSEFDEVHFDLSSINITESDLYLDVKLVAHDLYSLAAFDIDVTSPSLPVTSMTSGLDTDGNPELNLAGQFLLDSSTHSNNNFTFNIKPKSVSDYLLSSLTLSTDDVFPAYSSLSSNKVFYQLIVHIIKKTSSGDQLYSHYPYRNTRDNSLCMDGPKAYSVKSEASLLGRQVAGVKRKSDDDGLAGALACGSISFGDDGDGPSGPNSSLMLIQLLVGFLLALGINLLSKRSQLG